MPNLIDFKLLVNIIKDYWYLYQDALLYTIFIALGTVLIGVIISLVVSPLRMSKYKILRAIATIYIEVIRSTPLLVQLFIINYGIIPFFADYIPKFMIFGFIDSTRYIPCIIAIGINSGAYITEIIRAGIAAVDRGQTEAARSLGMTQAQTMKSIILPQAIKNILPALGNEFVTIIKESSVCMFIGVKEIMFIANDVTTRTYAPMEPLIIAALLYFSIAFPLSKLMAYFERRMSRGDKR